QMVPFYRDGKIRIGTAKGVWESDFYEAQNAQAQIMVDQLTKSVFACDSSMNTFTYVDHSTMNHSGASWEWNFVGGIPSTGNTWHETVAYPGPGTYMTTLKVTDGIGNIDYDTLYTEILSTPNLVQEGFELGIPAEIKVINSDSEETWKVSPNNAGGYATSNFSILMDNYSYNQQGEYDDFQFSFDLSSGTDLWLTFDVAYTPFSATLGDSLEVLVSADCGLTYQKPYAKAPADLATVTIGTTYPDSSSWRTDSVDLAPFTGAQELLVLFRNINGYGNKLYIDNINISNPNVSSVDDPAADEFEINVYANPVSSGQFLTIQTNLNEPITFELYDANGKIVLRSLVDSIQKVNINKLGAGVYFYHARTKSHMQNGKIFVTN
ncbi:MAG: T9SS type A sorting domain-containing protein, partial [Crocinitomicaceae bacterium]|nr:T9SS type A sorting domain-containing protein [Crocinitomicaceae bacterium]